MVRFLVGVVALFLSATVAFAQSGASVKQSGSSVIPNSVPYWVTNGVIGGQATSADSPITSFGVTSSGQLGACVNSSRQVDPNGYIGLCLGYIAGVPTISVQNYGAASAQPLNFLVNGTTYPFPGALASLIIGSTPVLSGTNGDCLNITSGILGQVPCSILAAGTTGSGAVVLQNSPTLAGTIGGNLTFGGNETFTGNVAIGSQLIVNGVATPATASNQTVIGGPISPPTLTNTGQAWLFNQAVAGATLQGDGSSFDVTIVNKNGGVALEIPTGTTGVTFPGVLTLSGLSSGSCAASVLLDSSNHTITGSCPGAASSIQVGSTTVSSGTSNNLLYNNAGTLGNNTIASFLTAGTGIGITGTTNATIALSTPVSATNGGSGVSAPTAHGVLVSEGSSAFTPVVGSTTGQCVNAQGASADPLFASGCWVLLNTLTANNTSTTLTDTTSITSTYSEYEIVLEQLLPATNNITAQFQVQVSGTFQTGTYLSSDLIGTGSTTGSASNTTGVLISNPSGLPNTAPGLNARYLLSQPGVTLTCKAIYGEFAYISTTVIIGKGGGCYNGGSAAITGIQAATSSGNWTSGKMKIYGRVN